MLSQIAEDQEPLLSVNNVSFSYQQAHTGPLFKRNGLPSYTPFALNQVSLTLYPKGSIGLIGESTCGKSTLGKLIIHLLTPDRDGGGIEFYGDGLIGDISNYSRKELCEYRKRVQMIFQNPDASLNAGMKAEDLVLEAIRACPKKRYTKAEARERMDYYFQMMNIRGKESSYPDTLSGGEKRRIGVIRALALEPDLIVADEPFANLDVSLRNHFVNIFQLMRSEENISFLFILHDMDLAYFLCDSVAVMYHGRIVEMGDRAEIFDRGTPTHPYTATLLAASDMLNDALTEDGSSIPVLKQRKTPSCIYRSRCMRYRQWEPGKRSICENEPPGLKQIAGNHRIACHFWEG